MQTLESIQNKLESATDLFSVVKTMKAMAAVNIHQYEAAVESLQEYNRTIELGLQIVLRNRTSLLFAKATKPLLGAIVFGTDQGMCGQFNDRIAAFAINEINKIQTDPKNSNILTIGLRVMPPIQDAGLRVHENLSLPGSIGEITSRVQKLALLIEKWRDERGIEQILLFYNKKLSGSSYEPYKFRLLPLDSEWLYQLQAKEWPTRLLPQYTMTFSDLFAALIRHYFFVSLYRAYAESMASENASRLAAMQAAEKNIKERLSELRSQHNHQRQSAITAELLDVVSGFEALRKETPQEPS
ncbi:F0F1 ATP synthase subunit gamma [candidate division KSB1 bacterium]|nr:F0F1 ATP synthase subunit gamma [candidate division KSB1 bacterium]